MVDARVAVFVDSSGSARVAIIEDGDHVGGAESDYEGAVGEVVEGVEVGEVGDLGCGVSGDGVAS